MKNHTVVFSGPSLSAQDLEQHLPNALYHHPVRCQDILRLLRTNPTRLVIIDGYFEKSAAVWHKEILFALEQGVDVIGASSMGALRAAELSPYGMQGFGKVFEAYQSGEVIGDDEVALIHHSSHHQFTSHIIPMINIRFTVKAAIAANVLSDTDAETLIRKAKALPYYARHWGNVWSDERTLEWLQANTVDQKKEDALQLVQALRQNTLSAPDKPPCKFPHTLYFNKLRRHAAATPIESPYPWLPLEELHFCHLMQKDFSTHISLWLKLMAVFTNIQEKKHHLLPISLPALLKQFWKNTKTSNYQQYYLLYFRLDCDSLNKMQHNIISLNIQILCIVKQYLEEHAIDIAPMPLQQFSNQFRKRQKLLTQEKTEQWINSNFHEMHDYKSFIHFSTLIHLVLHDNFSDFIGLPMSDTSSTWIHALMHEPMFSVEYTYVKS